MTTKGKREGGTTVRVKDSSSPGPEIVAERALGHDEAVYGRKKRKRAQGHATEPELEEQAWAGFDNGAAFEVPETQESNVDHAGGFEGQVGRARVKVKKRSIPTFEELDVGAGWKAQQQRDRVVARGGGDGGPRGRRRAAAREAHPDDEEMLLT